MTLVIRQATHADTGVLTALIERSARALSAGYYTEAETEAAIRHVFGVDTTLVDDGTYLVAEQEGRVVGCGGWSARATLYGADRRPVGSNAPPPEAPAAARIRAFFVEPDVARQGIGRAILQACEAAAALHGFRRFELMATLPGVPFYTRHGYRTTHSIVDVLPDGTPIEFRHMVRDQAEDT